MKVMKKITTKQMVFLAFLIAIKLVLSRMLAIEIPGLSRISLSFVSTAIMAVYFGPGLTALGCGVGDIIGAMLFPKGGAYFPGFTLSAMIIGYIYGVCLYKKHFSWWRIIVMKIVIMLVITLGLNTYFLTIFTGKAYLALMIPRLTETLLMMPIEVLLLGLTQKYLMPQLTRRFILD